MQLMVVSVGERACVLHDTTDTLRVVVVHDVHDIHELH